MDGYEIEELYYLYRQGCPIAQEFMIEYFYWQARMMLPAYYYTSAAFRNNFNDFIQIIVIRCLKSLDNYRPDRGMQVKSFISLLIQNGISSSLARGYGKLVREHQIQFSLDDSCDEFERIKYVDSIRDERTPELIILEEERSQRVNEYILKRCSTFEQDIINYHKQGLRDCDIAQKLNVDVRCIYNANYRIQKKMRNSNLFD